MKRRLFLTYVILFWPILDFAGTMDLVSISNSGTLPNNNCEEPSLSYDGRYVAFRSSSTNLVPGINNGYSQDYVYDHLLNNIECVSLNNSGQPANLNCANPKISYDGRYIVFNSMASNLVTNDTNGTSDIFVYDRETRTIECVNVDDFGNQTDNGGSESQNISGDGRYVVYDSSSTDLVSDDLNGKVDIFVYDRISKTVEMVSINDAGIQGNGDSIEPSASYDGRFIAFKSFADNLMLSIPGISPDQIYVYDRSSKIIECVSRNELGNPGTGVTGIPFVSGDGRYVSFSTDEGLVSIDTNNAHNGYVYDQLN